MQHICPKCLYKGIAKYTILDNLNIPIAGFFLGLGFYMLSMVDFSFTFYKHEFILLVIFCFPFFFIGTFLIYNYYEKNSNLCPKCNYGQMVIINSNKANKLIEDNNLEL